MNATEDVPMFEVETPPVVTPKRPRGQSKPKWTRYRLKNPVKCDDCMLVLTLAKGEAPPARFALYRRVQDSKDLLLCAAHAQDRRDEDGMTRELRPRSQGA